MGQDPSSSGIESQSRTVVKVNG